MKKRITYMMLGALLLGLLAGCGTGTAEPARESADASSAEHTEANASAPSVQETPEVPAEPEASPVVEESPEPTEAVEIGPESFFQDYLDEPPAAEMYADVADKFELREYVDEESGLTIPYNFFVPAEAESEPCPMIMFIGDATCAGTDPSYSLSQGYGGIIWAIESEQAKHPCYVLVPAFPETVIDDNRGVYVSDYVEATARLVEAVAAGNNVDTDRIYTTGQSMGCMTSLYLASHHPDLFAAELFVSGQWDVSELQGLETQTFFYVAAAGDPKASSGQTEVMGEFDSKSVPYSVSYDWDATLGDADLENAIRAEIEEGNSINFGQFAAGTVIQANNRGIEHMSSFDCAYKLDAVRNWLFAQSK